MTTGKTIALTRWTFVGKVVSLLFNMLSRLVIAFLPRSKHLLISWLQSPSAVILEPPKIKSVTVSIVAPSIYHDVMGPDAMIFVFWMLSLKPAFSLCSFTFIKFSSVQFSRSVVSDSLQPHGSFPASGSFQMSQSFASGGQSIGISASASVLPMNFQDWFPSGLTGLISLQSKGHLRIFSNTTVQKHQFFGAQISL